MAKPEADRRYVNEAEEAFSGLVVAGQHGRLAGQPERAAQAGIAILRDLAPAAEQT